MHSELSEAPEALKKGNPPDSKLPEFSNVEFERANVIIRIMDMSANRKWRVAEARVAKHEFNKSRLHKHGGKKFQSAISLFFSTGVICLISYSRRSAEP
jgi:hypothetical protein